MFKEEIGNMKKEVENVKCESKSFAFELLSELKKRAKRDFIIILILMIALVVTNISWFIYTTDIDYGYEEINQEQIETNNSNMNGEIN